MTILAYGTRSFAAQTAADRFGSLRANLDQATSELSTGKIASTFAGLGAGAAASLSVRSQLASVQDSQNAIADGTLRLQVMNVSLTQIAKLSTALPTSLGKSGAQTPVGASSASASAYDALDTTVEALNAEVDGRYLFSGRAADTRPVVPTNLMLDGDANRAGLKTLVAERKQADAGTGTLGRLAIARAGSTVTLGEESAGLPFGLKVGTSTATGTGIAVATTASPAGISITVATQPATGDAITVPITLPDGTTSKVTLVAGSGATGAAGTKPFAIGATTAETAENIRAALAGAVGTIAATELPAASTMKAASQFFAADVNNPPVRVADPPFATATAEAAGTSANTVIWYQGSPGGSPRDTAPVRLSDSQTVGIGAAANEPAFRATLAAFAVFAADTFPSTDATSAARYAALASRVGTTLAGTGQPQTVKDVVNDMALAGATLKSTGQQNGITKNQLQDQLSEVEDADPQEAAMKLLSTQTRLQASYQMTSTILKLSLVDYV